ncbi:MAG: CRISPR-associated endonuclease Cas1, partial [Spirochaetes bacterium]|nr:CRISPR-associated endonuclease Cas1 [Spirochaetota bacterium]
MQLIINTRGSYLHKKGECFEIRSDNKKHEISCKKVSSIIISTAVNLTSDAIKLAMENNIDIIFLDEFGNPYGRVWHSRLGSTTAIRRRQLEIAETKEGLDLASGWIKNKINNKIALLQDLRKTRSQKSAKITEYIKKIENIAGGLENLDGTIHTARSSIMGIEGSIGRIYFEVLSFLIPERFKFQGRSR